MDAVLGADIGGTNTRIALFTPQLKEILSERYKTVGKNPYVALSAMNEFAMRNSISIKSACIAVAAPVVKDEAKLTNAKITISLKGIQRALGVKKAILINDFEAMALGITVLRKHEATALNKIQPEKNGVKAIIGAGTGLGKAILAYNDKEKIFIPLQSEEGHAQISIADKEEYGLLEFIKKMKKKDIVYWEDVLSGRGIAMLYQFVSETNVGKMSAMEIETKKRIWNSPDAAAAIAARRKSDRWCKDAFALFSRFYARFAKTSALSCLPFGGLYIAGGIAAKNPDILLSRDFLEEWGGQGYGGEIRKKIPLFLVKSENLGLRGAAIAALRRVS